MRVKPFDALINWQYKCPKCETVQWVTHQEARTPNFKVVCHCGCAFTLETIRMVNLEIDYGIKSEPKKVNETKDKSPNKVVDLLVELGYTRAQASIAAAQANSNQPLNLILKESLAQLINV